jgi:predicted metal-binding membrane protein
MLRRERVVIASALGVLALLAWGWLVFERSMASGPGLAVSDPMAMEQSAWSAGSFASAFGMWWIMMVAMMVPAASPVILLHAKVSPRAQRSPPTGCFVAGYLCVWAAFSLTAAAGQGALMASGALAPVTMGSAAEWFAATVLLAAGFYQLSSYKRACLSHCRNPAAFLSAHFRPGRYGAFRLGVLHGGWCVGCCWLLMALLFVGGVMNIAWIAALTLLVAAEKLLPGGRRIAVASGLGLVAWGLATAMA